MSSVAGAEQGCIVSAIDIHEPSLKVARIRAECYGLSIDIRNCNATDIAEEFKGVNFDLFIFSASIEHMTHSERMKAMRVSWNMLSKGGVWAISHTPNRLWYYDCHTSLLPFFHWLPDDLALEYVKNSPRTLYSQLARVHDREAAMEFLIRGGRGISYHEFALSIMDPEKLNVYSSLDGYIRKNPLRYLAWRMSDKYRYQKILRKAGPKIHQAFYEELLSFAILKD